MPTRLVREGILSSEAVCSLSWAEEVLYRRLHSVVDDYGRFTASTKLIRAACYPLQIDKVSDSDIGKWLTGCVEAGLVRVYPAQDGKRYLEVLKFGQQLRSKSKYPPPDECVSEHPQASDNNCFQTQADAHLDVFVSEVVSVSDKPPPSAAEGRFDEFWKAYPNKVGKDAARKAFAKRKPTDELLAAMVRAINMQSSSEKWTKDNGQYIPHPSTWLNEGRWMDEIPAAKVRAPYPAMHALTTPSSAAAETAAHLKSQRLTPEQKAAADAIRLKAMEAIRKVQA